MNDDSFDNREQWASITEDENNRGEGESLAVDDRGIPILDEVIEPDLDLSDDSALVPGLDTEPHGLNLPDKEVLLDALKQQMLSQFEQELEGITHQIAEAVTAQLSHNMEQTIREELQRSLSGHLETMLERTLKQPDNILNND
jgi:hypothetical protein